MSHGYVSDEPDEPAPRVARPVVDADPFKREMETTIYANMNDTVRKYTQNPNALRTVADIMERIRPLLERMKSILVANKSYLQQQRGIAQGSNVNEYSPHWFANAISNVFPENPNLFSKMLIVLQPLEMNYDDDSIKINDLFLQTYDEIVPLLQKKLPAISLRDRTISEREGIIPPRSAPAPHTTTRVQMDEPSSLCLYFRDPISMSASFVRTTPRTQYDLSTLFCLTPSGIVNDLITGVDFAITEGQLTLNPSNIKQIAFLTTGESQSHDHPKMTLTFPNFVCNLPFIQGGVTESLGLYVPPNQQDVVIPISYHSDYVDVTLPRIKTSHLHAVISIDPNQMIERFAEDMRNVHLHANLQLPQCPMEQLVSARVNFEHLTEPICSFLDNLFASTASMDDSRPQKHAMKIPYIYRIDMQTMTCTRIRMLRHELENAIPLVTPAEFVHYNAITTTPDGLNLEQHLIRYTLFQMMLSYRKFTLDDFRTCPVHHITFDLYLRRGAGDIGYHYDLTPGNIVSSVGLLYSMPHGHVKMGPQLIPRRYRRDGDISDSNVMPMSAFITRNTVALLNNVTYSHSTPDLEHIISRTPRRVGYEIRNEQHESIFYAALNVTYDPITFPARLREKLTESSSNPSRTFLRSWHIVDISQEQMANLAAPEAVAFTKGMPFSEMARITLLECFTWVSAAGCMCIEVGMDPVTGEIVPPSKLPGHLRGGRIPMSFGSPKTSKIETQTQPQTQLKSKSKTQYSSAYRSKLASPIRASTVSISHLKQQIGSKLKKIRAVLKNPKKNFVVMSGPRTRSRSHSHTQNASKKRSRGHSRSRKVRSAN